MPVTGQHAPIREVGDERADERDHPLLTRRDVDDLRQTVSGLNMTMVRVEQAIRELTKAIVSQQADTKPTVVPAVALEPGPF